MTGPVLPRNMSRAFDLPPRWDGRVVMWSGWEESTVFLCAPPEREACTVCGSVTPPAVNRGTFYPRNGDTHEALVEVTAKRTGRRYLKGRTVRTKPHPRFLAFRCPDCRHDYVFDMTTETWWDLDDGDYGPDGST